MWYTYNLNLPRQDLDLPDWVFCGAELLEIPSYYNYEEPASIVSNYQKQGDLKPAGGNSESIKHTAVRKLEAY